MTSLMFESLELRSGELVLEEAVVGPSSKEVASTAMGVHGDATKTSGCAGAGAGQAGTAGRRRWCNAEVLCPHKACFVLKLRLHVLHEKPEQGGNFVGRTLACWPFGNITKRRKGSIFCRGSIAACRC